MAIRTAFPALPDFYPRPPRGGRPGNHDQDHDPDLYFYPRPPRGGRQLPVLSGRKQKGISIHALREEGDLDHNQNGGERPYFYPRPPRGGRPLDREVFVCESEISIHALREEGDRPASILVHARGSISIHALREEGDLRALRREHDDRNFYPRPPRGGRPLIVLPSHVGHLFLSTPSARRATAKTEKNISAFVSL